MLVGKISIFLTSICVASAFVKDWVHDPKGEILDPRYFTKDGTYVASGARQFTNIRKCTVSYPEASVVCVKFEEKDDTPEYVVMILYLNTIFEKLTVSSCDEKYIINNIFLPTSSENFDFHYFTISFTAQDKSCYKRECAVYKADARTHRYDPEVFACPSKKTEKFQTNQCHEYTGREVVTAGIVKAWVPDDTPKVSDPRYIDDSYNFIPEADRKYTEILECKISHNTGYFKLTCIQFEEKDGKPKYVAVIEFYSACIDKLVVSSCDLKDIMDNIFPPSHIEGALDKTLMIRFRSQDKSCYSRKYVVKVLDCSTTCGKVKHLFECPSGENEKFKSSVCKVLNK